MSYNLQIQFSGLCAFVPSDKLENMPNFTVLLVNTRQTDVATLDGGDCAFHYPILEFPLANVAPAVDPNVASTMVPWKIDTFELRLSVPGHTPRGVKVDLSGGGTIGEVPKADQSDAHDFRWVPQLEEVLPDCVGIGKDMLAFPRGNDAVSARVVLNDGGLGVVKVSDFNGDPVVAHFAPERSASRICRAVARTIALTITGIVGPVTFSAYDIRSMQETKVADLMLTPVNLGGQDQDILVRITNLCPDQFLAIAEQSTELPYRDEDFAWLYVLTKGIGVLAPDMELDPAKVPVPVPIKYTIKGGGQGGGEPIKCASARTNPPQ